MFCLKRHNRDDTILTRSLFREDLLFLSLLDYRDNRDHRWMPEDFEEWLSLPGRRGLARFRRKRLVGFVLYSVAGDYSTIEIERLLVDSRYRRQQHGSRLVWEAVDSIANYWEPRSVRAWVSEVDQAAIGFFLANRFVFSRSIATETHIVDGVLRDELLYSFTIPAAPGRGKE